MSLNLESAFNKILDLQSRSMTFHDLETDTQATVRCANSNYFRNLSAPEDMVIEGREFVVSKKDLDAASFPALVRGIKVIDSELGTNTISEVRDMVILGKIVGYRIRTS